MWRKTLWITSILIVIFLFIHPVTPIRSPTLKQPKLLNIEKEIPIPTQSRQMELLELETTMGYNKNRLLDVYLTSLEIEREIGVPALFSTAQAVIEATWELVPIVGKDGTNSNNIFGIKGKYNGKSVIATTKEWDGKKYVTIDAEFRAYPSIGECMKDHTKLLTSTIKGSQGYSYFDCLLEYRKTKDLKKYAEKVLKIYATSPSYSQIIFNVMDLVKERTRESWKVEQEEAKTWAVTEGILKPDDSLDYWDRPLTRKELVVILKRIKSIGGA